MAYATPHTAREYFAAATMFVCHDYILQCQYASPAAKRALLTETYEIDLHARVAAHFGSSAHIFAQGIAEVDIQVGSPTLRAEVKYASANSSYAGIAEDWIWLRDGSNAGNEFAKKAMLIFFPSTRLFTLTQCVSVSKDGRDQFRLSDFTVLTPLAEPVKYASSNNQKLRFKSNPERLVIIQIPDGKRFRVDLIGNTDHALWAAVYTRITPEEHQLLAHVQTIQINDDNMAPVLDPADHEQLQE